MIRIRAPPGFDFAAATTTAGAAGRRLLLGGAAGGAGASATPELDMEYVPASEMDKYDKFGPTGEMQTGELGQYYGPRQLNARGCDVDLRTDDGLMRWVQGDDIVCEVTGSPDKGVYMAAKIKSTEKPVLSTKRHLMTVAVYNRPSTNNNDNGGVFELETFKTSDSDAQSRLDLTQIPGFTTLALMFEWSVTLADGQKNGMQPVRGILFKARLPDELRNEDEIIVIAPQDFDLRAPQSTAGCNMFKWEAGVSPFPPPSDRPACECRTSWVIDGVNRCGLTFVMSNLLTPVMTETNALQWRIDTTNPAQVKKQIGNYWTIEHKRKIGTDSSSGVPVPVFKTMSTHAAGSWDINPQLFSVSVAIDGERSAAESRTDILIAFVPVQKASVLEIRAMQPADFMFDAATVDGGYEVDGATGNNKLVINNVGILPGTRKSLKVRNVKLGVQGGETVWWFQTYDRKLVGGLPRDESDKRDQAYNVKGFVMPGILLVQPGSQKLESDYQQNPAVHPTASQFPARENELNYAELAFSVSQRVYARSLLVLLSEGPMAYRYLLKAEGFSLVGQGAIPIQSTLDPITGALHIDLKPEAVATESALAPGQIYKMRFRTTPKRGPSPWRIATYASRADFETPGILPTNTNDGMTGPFSPVATIGFEVLVLGDRRPPAATIDLQVKISPGDAPVRQVIIIGPPGFDFPNNCGNMCMPYNSVGVNNRKSIKIESPQGVALQANVLDNLQIKCITPRVTPSRIDWFVQTRTGSPTGQGMLITGWNDATGFKIKQMTETYLWYPSRRGLKAAFFAFTFKLSSDNGKVIEVNAPVLYQLYCSTMPDTGRPALQPISLPGARPACVDSPLTLTLDTPLYMGTYSFIIGGDIPQQAPPMGTVQYFSLIVRNDKGAVLDAAYELPAVSPLQEIMAKSARLSWDGIPQRQKVTVVRAAIDFEQPTLNIKALLITFPPGLTHDIQTSTDVKNLNKAFPVAAASSWVDHGSPAYIKILTNDQGTANSNVIPIGTYTFEFPILFPLNVPPENVWYFSLCSSRSCYDIFSQGMTFIPMVFPMPGFAEGEVAPDAVRTSGAVSTMRVFGSGYGLTVTVVVGVVRMVVFGMIGGGWGLF